jgi:hypothetical protein
MNDTIIVCVNGFVGFYLGFYICKYIQLKEEFDNSPTVNRRTYRESYHDRLDRISIAIFFSIISIIITYILLVILSKTTADKSADLPKDDYHKLIPIIGMMFVYFIVGYIFPREMYDYYGNTIYTRHSSEYCPR